MTIIELLEELNRNPEGQELLKTVKNPKTSRNTRLFLPTSPPAAG